MFNCSLLLSILKEEIPDTPIVLDFTTILRKPPCKTQQINYFQNDFDNTGEFKIKELI